MTTTAPADQDIQRFRDTVDRLRTEVHKVIVGQDAVVDAVLTALLANGHVLLEGVPGTAKTMLVRTLAAAMHLEHKRIQFTPDLMPADVVGTVVLDEGDGGARSLRFQPGPIHANLVLADEINRATPKTQAALLEAMQERQVTAGGETRKLPDPFAVLATQNPVEQEGTYPLPEAQLDRFLFKVLVGYPEESDYDAILERTTGRAMPEVSPVTDAATIQELQGMVRDVPVPDLARSCAVQLVMATQPDSPYATDRVNRYVALGASPRGAQALILAGKVAALWDGRAAVSADDVLNAAAASLRHRVLLNFDGLGEGITTDDLIEEIVRSKRA